jgi:hypothetical protein
MQQSNNNGGGLFIPTDAVLFGQQREQQQLHNARANNEEVDSSSHHHQLRRSLRRISLDLSGRVMCHVISPPKKILPHDNDHDEDSESRTSVETSSSCSSVPLFQIPRFGNNNNKTLHRLLQRHIPHVYIGANYDLDEVWYGATRWIVKCSWRQLPKITRSRSSVGSGRARQLVESVFLPITATTTAKRSPLMLDLEREQSVFEHSDSTMRVSLLQHHSHPVIQGHDDSSSTKYQSHHLYHLHPPTVQKLSVEYDSSKYSNNLISSSSSLLLEMAPTISVHVQTPILHPRIELQTKKTWIVQEGGDKYGNYYGGAHYGSYCSPVDRRLERIREGYRSMVPRSQLLNMNSNNSLSSSSTTTTTTMGKLQTFGRNLSNWLEEDGWMPKRVTTDLMGNFVSINEVGFFCSEKNTIIHGGGNHEREEGLSPQQLPPTTTTITPTMRRKTFLLPPMDNIGLRLRISKRIDWTSLGIFPWSNNNNNNNNKRPYNNNPNVVVPPTSSPRVQFDICGLHKSGNSMSQIGCEFDPFNLSDTFKVVIGHDDVVVATW